jgi:hypothetical protein
VRRRIEDLVGHVGGPVAREQSRLIVFAVADEFIAVGEGPRRRPDDRRGVGVGSVVDIGGFGRVELSGGIVQLLVARGRRGFLVGHNYVPALEFGVRMGSRSMILKYRGQRIVQM